MNKKSKKPAPAKTKKNVSKGSKLYCEDCGLQLVVVDECDCAAPCDVICCGKQMTASC